MVGLEAALDSWDAWAAQFKDPGYVQPRIVAPQSGGFVDRTGLRYRSRWRGRVWRITGLTSFGWQLSPDGWATVGPGGGVRSLIRAGDELDDAMKWERVNG